VHASLRATGLHRIDQFAVWEGLEERIRGLEDRPPTSCMHAINEEDRESLEEAQRRLPWPAGACVVVAAIDGRIVCADLFDSLSPGTAASALPTAEKVSRFLYLPPDTPRGDLRLPRDRPEPALSHPGPGGQRPGPRGGGGPPGSDPEQWASPRGARTHPDGRALPAWAAGLGGGRDRPE